MRSSSENVPFREMAKSSPTLFAIPSTYVNMYSNYRYEYEKILI